MTNLGDLATTAKDLTPLLRSFREPLENNAQRIVDESWLEIMEELDLLGPDEDVVVLVCDSEDAWPTRRLPFLMHSVVPRATAIALTFPIDVRVADWLARTPASRPGFDIVVESRGALSLLQIEYAPGER
jgi:hypothetical protein